MTITILAYCSYPHYEIYERLAGSLYDTGFSGNLCIFAETENEENLKKLQKAYPKVKYVTGENSWALLRADHNRKNAAAHNVYRGRYELYKKYLEENEIKSKYVFISDSKDVLFQRNPEDYPIEEGYDLYVFAEGQKQIGQCNRNWRWVRTADILFETDTVPKLWKKQILCAGTT